MCSGKWCFIIGLLAIVASLFHLWVSGMGLMMSLKRNAVHLAFILSLAFLIYPARREKHKGPSNPNLLDVILAMAGIVSGAYVLFYWDDLAARGFLTTPET